MVFRGDWRCIWIPLIPTGATIVIAGLLSTLGGPLQLFVLGLGGSILGLAVDQGIHVYIGCQESAPLQRLSRLAKPLALGAGTSIVAFFLLIFTRSPTLQQLGVLASGALALSLVAAFFLLPTLLPASRGKRLQPKPPKVPKLKSLSPKIALILVLGLTALSFLPRLTTSFRIESLDGIPEKVREDENAFAATWQPVAPNLLLLRDPNVTQTPQLQTALTDCQPLTALDFWPAEEARKKNLDAWKNAPLDEWERQLAEAAKTCGLPYEFYKPFFEGIRLGLAEPPSRPPDWFQQARQRLCHNGIMIFFLAKPDRAQDILNHSSFDAALLTPEALRATLTRDFGSHLIWIITAATAVIILLTLVSLHSLKKVLFALLPVFLTLRWLSAGFALVGHPITLMTAIGSVLLIGLSIDYGVFAVQWLDDGSNSSIPHAMLLSAITTVFTTGILLFSKHPVLFDLGIVLSFGITLSYLIARFLVPALAHLSFRNSSALLFVLTFSVLLSGCQNIYPSRPGLTSETARSELQVLHQTQSVNTRSIQAKVTARFFWHHIPFIVVGQLNEETRELRVAGLAPTGGAKLFQITATPSEILSSKISPMAPAIARRAFERIAKDLACAFLDNLPEIPASISPDSRGIIHFAVNGLNYTFAGEPLRLYRKASQKPRWAWKRDPANPQIWLFRDPNAHLCLEVTFLP